jgi:hypothetical protein
MPRPATYTSVFTVPRSIATPDRSRIACLSPVSLLLSV